uniref:Placenta associated 8, tandem duplicate 1 n=1 Tax=Oreochromis aureus TaxID=47969 RepID=A0AAZ1XSE3_OREAU
TIPCSASDRKQKKIKNKITQKTDEWEESCLNFLLSFFFFKHLLEAARVRRSFFQKRACFSSTKGCFGYFCFCCLGCSIASDMGECCLCGLGMPIRSVYRTKYNIKGSMCNDYMVTMCCPLCTTCQLKRDINRRKEQGIF